MTAVERDERPAPDGAPPRHSPAFVAFALSIGIVAWMIHISAGSALVPVACREDLAWTIDALTAVTALACVPGVWAGVRILRSAGRSDDARADGRRIVGMLAVMANVASMVLIVTEGAMHLWLGACL